MVTEIDKDPIMDLHRSMRTRQPLDGNWDRQRSEYGASHIDEFETVERDRDIFFVLSFDL